MVAKYYLLRLWSLFFTQSVTHICLGKVTRLIQRGIWLRPVPVELYPCGGVTVGQVGTVLAATESIEVVQRLHTSQ